jgi:hypothetical protein
MTTCAGDFEISGAETRKPESPKLPVHPERDSAQKKSRASGPALKIVSTLFSRKFGFDLD